jgi:hypothetical protein
MSYELLHFRGAEEIIKSKNLAIDLQFTLEYIDDALFGTLHKRELLKMVLQEMDWINKDYLSILDGRRYTYKGYKRQIAMESCLSIYEYLQTALLRLQIGFDKKMIDMGVVLVNSQRAEKSPLGNTRELIDKEIEMLYPTISLPVTIALFDLGKPTVFLEGISKSDTPIADEKPASVEVPASPAMLTESSDVLDKIGNEPENRSPVRRPVPRPRKNRRAEKLALLAVL